MSEPECSSYLQICSCHPHCMCIVSSLKWNTVACVQLQFWNSSIWSFHASWMAWNVKENKKFFEQMCYSMYNSPSIVATKDSIRIHFLYDSHFWMSCQMAWFDELWSEEKALYSECLDQGELQTSSSEISKLHSCIVCHLDWLCRVDYYLVSCTPKKEGAYR